MHVSSSQHEAGIKIRTVVNYLNDILTSIITRLNFTLVFAIVHFGWTNRRNKTFGPGWYIYRTGCNLLAYHMHSFCQAIWTLNLITSDLS
jgi:hypothetical protein